MNRLRLAIIDRIVEINGSIDNNPESRIDEWLEALVKDINPKLEEEAVNASRIAIQTAALIPEERRKSIPLGEIILSADCEWRPVDSKSIFLNADDITSNGNYLVHSQLQSDPITDEALKNLGLDYMSSELTFKKRAEELFKLKKWEDFWNLPQDNEQILLWINLISEKLRLREYLHVRNIAGKWQPCLTKALLPGPIVPSDSSRDQIIAIDIDYHENIVLEELKKLSYLVDSPREKYDYRFEDSYDKYLRKKVTSSKPNFSHMEFLNYETVGPLGLMKDLSVEGKIRYTEALLNITNTFITWTMSHRTRQDIYPEQSFNSPAVETLREHGHIRLPYGVVKLADGLGENPANSDARRWLLEHPNSTLIREVFDIKIEPVIELIEESVPLPLIDEWPGLRGSLPSEYQRLELIRCTQVGFDRSSGSELDCLLRGDTIYLREDEESNELQALLREIGLFLSESKIEEIIQRITPEDIANNRAKIRSSSSDAERLLMTVGEDQLLSGLPWTLRCYWQEEGLDASGLEVAEAAIATYDVGALREYRHALGDLDPPKQWAGRRPAIEFVRSLGFGVEWAGEGKMRRSQYEEIAGPYILPPLHDYQRVIAENLRGMLRGESNGKRGLISLPTGSGKTRVAVQAIVEAISKEEYIGNVLWVADRDELCEQAVESWRQIWSNIGIEATPLKISRLWGNQKNPTPVKGQHVIIATVQTLYKRIVGSTKETDFLDNCLLVVFDEAHRSIARTYTGVMEELGLARSRRMDKSFLLGLTATPYRGHSEEETERLVNRYGQNRLDTGAFASDDAEDVTRELQEKEVLAQADHRTIEGGDFHLTEAELRDMLEKRIPWLPKRLESEIGADSNRTRRIIDAYNLHIHGRGWPTLIFATSVDHSKTLAALLNQCGVVSRPVDSNTHPSTRRKIVDEFRAGHIEALVNYGVFREGFDAPKTRAIMVARPVYSPNLYFQMIGRGLRGLKNGGNERCLILNVRDNIENYKKKLAFTELEWLWATSGRNDGG